MSDINEKLAKIFGFPKNTIRADIRIRPMMHPEVHLTCLVVDENSIPQEIENRFKLVEDEDEDEDVCNDI